MGSRVTKGLKSRKNSTSRNRKNTRKNRNNRNKRQNGGAASIGERIDFGPYKYEVSAK